MTQGIVVEIVHEHGKRDARAFTQSPVRIGRNALNEVVLDNGFVSQWHGAIQFGPQGVTYVDLGSTNGSIIGTERAPKNAPIRLTGDGLAPIRIGTVALYVRPPRTGEHERHSLINVNSAFNAPMAGRKATMLPNAAAASFAATKANETNPATLQDALAAVERTRPAYDAYRDAWQQVLIQVRHRLAPLPAELRAPTLKLILKDLPQIAREPELMKLMAELGISAEEANVFDADAWLRRLVPEAANAAGAGALNTPVAMERVGAALETLVQAFVELRSGKVAFCQEMGLGTGIEPNALALRRSGREVIAYLLDWNADGLERLEELRRSFADIAMHQVAVVAGVAEGGRDLLESVSPESNGKILVRAAWWTRLVPGHRLSTIRRRHAELIGEDGFTRVLFGGAFARAYWTVFGRAN